MIEARAYVFRQKASQAHQKAIRPNIPDETRRAWLIVERDWIKMAEREEEKLRGGNARHPSANSNTLEPETWRDLEAMLSATLQSPGKK